MVATDIMIFTKEFVSHCIWGVRYRSTHERFKYKTQNCTINASINQSIFRCGCYCYILKARNSCVKAFVSVCPSVHKSQAFETGPIDSHNICWIYIFNVPLLCVPILYWKFKAKVTGINTWILWWQLLVSGNCQPGSTFYVLFYHAEQSKMKCLAYLISRLGRHNWDLILNVNLYQCSTSEIEYVRLRLVVT